MTVPGVLHGAARGHAGASLLTTPHPQQVTACPGPVLGYGRSKSSLEFLWLPLSPTVPPAQAQEPHGLADEVCVATVRLEQMGDIFTSSVEDVVAGSSPARGRSFIGAARGTQPHGTAALTRGASAPTSAGNMHLTRLPAAKDPSGGSAPQAGEKVPNT